ncbi:hypothetical protein UT300004_11330 [Clostridium sardiniense]
MNERIEIKKIKEVVVKGRRTKSDPLPFYSCWAEVLNLYGKELYEAINNKLENTVIFKVRYCRELEDLRNKENFIVVWRGRKFNIYYPDFLNYRKDFIKLKCNEVL